MQHEIIYLPSYLLLKEACLVCDLTGPGKIYLQSRSADAFLSWFIPQLPKREH